MGVPDAWEVVFEERRSKRGKMVQPIRVMNMLVTVLLIAIFAAAGVMKLTPIISPEVHNELVRSN